MKYHDWHLSGYTVSDHGATIVLDLLWDYPGHEIAKNKIIFRDVVAYEFQHTDGAIITQIIRHPISKFIEERRSFIESGARAGLRHWQNDLAEYHSFLEAGDFGYWAIDSAIGFTGFIVAKSIAELP